MIELIPKICFLFFGLVGFNNFGCSITRHDFFSGINFILLNKFLSQGLLGWAKKSSGNIFLEGTLYYIKLNKKIEYNEMNYCCLLKFDDFVLVEYFFFVKLVFWIMSLCENIYIFWI